MRCTLSYDKVWPQGSQDREVLSAHVRLAVLNEHTHGKRSVASHLGVFVREPLRDQREHVLGERGHTALHSGNNLAEATDGRGAFAERAVL
jgi:hypothetical protein